MNASLLPHLLFQGVLLFGALGWEVRMPKEIHGLKGSCLVIPCSFSYTSYPPTEPNRVVWYQWVSKGYPLVYDPKYANNVIDKFRGKTDLYGGSRGDCSLIIKNLDQSHHREKIYPWIDPENVGWRTFAFYDVTSTILVDASPQLPSISISGGEKMGDKITVTCSASHTCPYSKPNIILNGIEGSDQINDYCSSDGQCRSTLTRSGVVKAENTTFQCSVTHHGGTTMTAKKIQSSECVHQKITIEPEMADITEGIKQIFTCTVYHSCQKENPIITWNYKNMQVSEGTKTLSVFDRVAYSNISFLGTTEDHGKKLTCTARVSGKNVEASVALRVQCVHRNITIEPEMADVTVGVEQNFTCTVHHFCQKENPTITWNYVNMQVSEGRQSLSGFERVAYSTITVLGAKEDHGKKLICSAAFSRGNITESVVLYLQNAMLTVLKTTGLYILTPSLVFLLACVIAGVIICKRRRRSKDASTVSGNKPFKPYMPSPKSQPKSRHGNNDYEDDYNNMGELDIYENN
ncbi:Schwann cell myelin protein-like [Danio aesculapii]|uniref:Schwann cell myelin protein-like n=1 Tax=Danio aesculapii TaxID=1142201 RepID=UPI0024C0C834|nr:Schwann cell myelin protein-like [Danio aesculapii]